MDFYNMIKNLDDEQIRTLISLKIAELSYKSNINKKRFIGINCGINPNFTLDENEEEDNKSMWFGYIPEDIKVIYWYDTYKGKTVNNGGYYYMDNSIVYEFALFVKNKKAANYLEFLDLVWEFVNKYFYMFGIPANSRDEMLSPLLRDHGWYFEPTIEHNITMFKGRSNAMCSEITAVAQNILTVFGYQSMYFIGAVQSEFGIGPHAFNIAFVEDHALLLDYTIPVRTYDLKGNIVEYSPYVGVISNFTPEMLINSSKNDEPLDFQEYDLYTTDGDTANYHEKESKRYYALGNINFFKEHPNYRKPHKKLSKIILFKK